jgi:hypothetical protein
MAGLKYVPTIKPNSSRGWRNTVAIETVIEALSEKFPEFEDTVNKDLKIKFNRIQLTDSSIRLTYYSEGKEEIINV